MDVLNNNYVKEYTAFLYTNGRKLSDEARNLVTYYSITIEE